VRFIAASVEEAIPRLAGDRWDAVVLDPPRQGCPPSVLTAVFERMKPARAVYVSCNPDALAKDLPVILKAGYRVSQVQAVDMFPHTDHIETVVVLGRR
jgi:23S rRNA (uracil1939-C5)-methyltransferase